jgi:glutathione S-transferase
LTRGTIGAASGSGSMLTLYNYWSSVCSQKARLCLAEKDLAYENKPIDLFTFEHWQPAYKKLNPKGVVPTLVHDGRVIIESNVIIEYLEDAFPAVRLRPDDAYETAQLRIWLFNSEEIAHPNVNTASHNLRHAPRLAKKPFTEEQLHGFAATCPNPIIAARFLHRQRHGVTQAEEDQAYANLDYLLGMMEAALQPGPWLVGKAYSLADIAMAPYINRVEVLARPELVSAARRPRIAAWWQAVQARPAFKLAFAMASADKDDPVTR